MAIEFGMWRCERSGRASGSITNGKGRLRAARDTECRMMVKATPTAAFIVTETKFLLEFETNSLDPPAKFGLIDHTCERDVGGQCGKPVVIRFGFTLRPLDQQPFFSRRLAPPGVVMGRADPPSGKPRG